MFLSTPLEIVQAYHTSEEQFKLHQIRDVCTLLTRGLTGNGMIRMLPYQFKNELIESLRNRKKT